MTIVVTTPTGSVGSRVVELLIQAGERPRVLVRDPARLPLPVRARVETVAVDLTDDEAIVAATKGAGALYSVAPAGSADDPVAGYAGLGGIAARAVTENGIARTVFQSSAVPRNAMGWRDRRTGARGGAPLSDYIRGPVRRNAPRFSPNRRHSRPCAEKRQPGAARALPLPISPANLSSQPRPAGEDHRAVSDRPHSGRRLSATHVEGSGRRTGGLGKPKILETRPGGDAW